MLRGGELESLISPLDIAVMHGGGGGGPNMGHPRCSPATATDPGWKPSLCSVMAARPRASVMRLCL